MFRIVLCVFIVFAAIDVSCFAHEEKRWAVYYSDQASVHEFAPYSLVVLDGDYHPLLEGFLERGQEILGYLSLGEARCDQSFFKTLQNEEMLLHENSDWEGNYVIDIRDKRWSKRVIEELVPALLYQRFDGVFLDTLDSSIGLEQKDPEEHQGMKLAAIELVKAIRYHYPTIKIMMNRAFDILPDVAFDIDMALGEGTLTKYDFKKKKYELVSDQNYREVVQLLKEGQEINPSLEVYTLDYWNLDDSEEIKNIYRKQRQNGFIPYVSTITLDQVVPEPNHDS